jgi:hypothetical protein
MDGWALDALMLTGRQVAESCRQESGRERKIAIGRCKSNAKRKWGNRKSLAKGRKSRRKTMGVAALERPTVTSSQQRSRVEMPRIWQREDGWNEREIVERFALVGNWSASRILYLNYSRRRGTAPLAADGARRVRVQPEVMMVAVARVSCLQSPNSAAAGIW